MARKGRIRSSKGLYHIVLRGEKVLFLKESDCQEFKNTLKKYFQNTDSLLYAYSLEKNKIHLVFYTPSDIGMLMKPLLTSYARYINRTYKKNGKLFYDRYISEPIEENEILIKAIFFVNERSNTLSTSKTEYFGKKEICSIDKDILNELKNQKIIYPFVDDYAAMKDDELKKYLFSVGTKDRKKDREELLRIALEYSNLSKARVKRILGITKVEKVVRKPKPQHINEPVKQQKQELSVWLL